MTKVTQAHIDARTEAILSAAEKMFVRKGVDSATVQEIAAQAGLSAGAIYRYFSSKEDLLRAVWCGTVDRARELFSEAAASTDSPLEALRDIGRSAWSEFEREGCCDDVILSLEATLAAVRQPEELAAPRREMLNALIDMLERLIRQAQGAGEIDAAVDARALASMLLACHLGSGLLALQLDGGVDTDGILAVVMDMLQRMAPVGNRPA